MQIPPTILYSYGYNKYITCLAIYHKKLQQNQQKSQILNCKIILIGNNNFMFFFC